MLVPPPSAPIPPREAPLPLPDKSMSWGWGQGAMAYFLVFLCTHASRVLIAFL